jgi:hypothetical protein
LWLAGAPVLEVKVLLLSLATTSEHRAYLDLIEECWRARLSKRRYTVEGRQHTVSEVKGRHTVPWRTKKIFCQIAIAHVIELDRQSRDKKSLRAQGMTNEQIIRWFGPRYVRSKFKPPELQKVLEIVNRKAPPITLRRKAAAEADEREVALAEYNKSLKDASRTPAQNSRRSRKQLILRR